MTWSRRLRWRRSPSAAVIVAAMLLAACSSGRSVAQPAGTTPTSNLSATATASPSATAADASWHQRQDCTVPQGLLPAGTRETSCVRLQGGDGFAFGTSSASGDPAGFVGVVVSGKLVTICPAPPNTGAATIQWGSFECDWPRTRDVTALRRDSRVQFRFDSGDAVWIGAADHRHVVFTVDGGRLVGQLAKAPTGWYFTAMYMNGQEADYLPVGQVCQYVQTTGPGAGPHPPPCSGEADAIRLLLEWNPVPFPRH